MVLEDLYLGACEVVLREMSDLLEQLRTASVVEVLGWQVLAVRREPVVHVLKELGPRVGWLGEM